MFNQRDNFVKVEVPFLLVASLDSLRVILWRYRPLRDDTECHGSVAMNQQAIIVHLLREGEWHQAVLLYREETGAPRHLATREVERIAQQHNIKPNGTWWRWPVARVR